MAVQKRVTPAVENIPVKEEPLRIRVKDNEYDVPTLTLREYKKVLKTLGDTPDDLSEQESLDYTLDFYYKLLKPEHPELKKSDLEDMPLYQHSAEFIIRLKMALYQVPLGS